MGKSSGGARLKEIRHLMGLTRIKFEELTGIPEPKMNNIENERQRVDQPTLEQFCLLFPEFTRFLVYEGPIDYNELNSNTHMTAKMIAFRIQNNDIPKDGIFAKALINVPEIF